ALPRFGYISERGNSQRKRLGVGSSSREPIWKHSWSPIRYRQSQINFDLTRLGIIPIWAVVTKDEFKSMQKAAGYPHTSTIGRSNGGSSPSHYGRSRKCRS